MITLRKKTSNIDYSFFVVDAHHHIGTDVDGHENSPTGPTGSYSFTRKILNGDGINLGLQEELINNQQKYDWTIPDGATKNQVKIITYYPLMKIFGEYDPMLSEKYSFEETLALDQIIVFPMHDKFRMNDGVEYRASNKLIQKWTEMYPHSLRFLGFGRVNPKEDIETAVKEMERFVHEGGLRGVKLHPSSEDFLMDSPNINRILREAAFIGIPVIFHTTYAHEVKALYESVNKIIQEMFEAEREKLIPKLKIIIGHCTYQSDDVFLALSHPNIYGELSTLNKPEIYLKKIAENVDIQRFYNETLPKLQEETPEISQVSINKVFGYNLPYLKWSNKIMLGTDYPYMPVTHTIDLIKTLLGKDLKLGIGPMDIQNILGTNILRLVPPKFALTKLSRYSEGIPTGSHREFIEHLISKKLEITGLDPLLGQTPVLPMAYSDGVISISQDSEEKISFLLSSSYLKSASKKGKSKNIETIHNITEDDGFFEIIDKNVSPREFNKKAGVYEKFLEMRMK